MSGGEVAGLIVAAFWAILVCFLAYVLVALGSTLKQLTKVVSDVGEQTVPILAEVTVTVATTNLALARVDGITSNVSNITRNASALTSIVTSSFGNPLIKAVSFSFGVRRALGGKKTREVQKRVKDEMRKQERTKRSRRKAQQKAVKTAAKRAKP